MNANTGRLITETGISPEGMALIDGLAIQAFEVAEAATTDPEGAVTGDPLYSQKLALATYVAGLEQACEASGVAGLGKRVGASAPAPHPLARLFITGGPPTKH